MTYEIKPLSNKSKEFINNLSFENLQRLRAYLNATRYFGIIKNYTFNGLAKNANPHFIQGELAKYRSILLNCADPFNHFTTIENGYTYIEYENLSTEVLEYLANFFKNYMVCFNKDKSSSIKACSTYASKTTEYKLFSNPIMPTPVKTLKVLDSNRISAINYIDECLTKVKTKNTSNNLVATTSIRLAETDESLQPASKLIIYEEGLKSDGKDVVQVINDDGEVDYMYTKDLNNNDF